MTNLCDCCGRAHADSFGVVVQIETETVTWSLCVTCLYDFQSKNSIVENPSGH